MTKRQVLAQLNAWHPMLTHSRNYLAHIPAYLAANPVTLHIPSSRTAVLRDWKRIERLRLIVTPLAEKAGAFDTIRSIEVDYAG